MFGARAAAAEVGPPPLAPQPYRVFISYSHRADSALAEALAATLTRFARPWWAPRAMKVFLDKNSMASADSLEKSIRNGLARCEWLLLACPDSAASPWQGVDGSDFDWAITDALPAEPLHHRFARGRSGPTCAAPPRRRTSGCATRAFAPAFSTSRRASTASRRTRCGTSSAASSGCASWWWSLRCSRSWPSCWSRATSAGSRTSATRTSIRLPSARRRCACCRATRCWPRRSRSPGCGRAPAADGSVAVVTVFDGQRLLTLAPRAAASAPLLALDTAQTRRFASLDAAGRIAAYDQPLCGDTEAVCAFARGRIARGLAPGQWRRWIPKEFDLKAAVRQPPKKGGACEALINEVLTPP